MCDTKCFLVCASVNAETGRLRKVVCFSVVLELPVQLRQPPLELKESLLRKNCKD